MREITDKEIESVEGGGLLVALLVAYIGGAATICYDMGKSDGERARR